MDVNKMLDDLLSIKPTRAHIELLKEQIKAIEKERDEVTAERNRLRHENNELNTKLTAVQKKTEFEESDGVFWKRKSDGNVEIAPYCPNCARHPKMTPFPPFGKPMSWVCSLCKFSVGAEMVTRPR